MVEPFDQVADVIPQKTGYPVHDLVNVVRLVADEVLFPRLVFRYAPKAKAITIKGINPMTAALPALVLLLS